LYLAVVIDLFSRQGWSMCPDMRRNLVVDALEMAWYQRRPDRNKTGRRKLIKMSPAFRPSQLAI
jgi:transposase InsO family protein